METVETSEKIVEATKKICVNTIGNGRKWLGNWGNIKLRESPQ